MNSCLLSVIITFYKGEQYIEQAVQSVLLQPYKNIEILLINDGSPTGDDVCESLARANQRVRYLKKKNEGAGAARNYGIENATGEYIAFLDQDDVWVTKFLTESSVSEIVNGGDVIVFSYYRCNEKLTRGNLIAVKSQVLTGGTWPAQSAGHHSSMFFSKQLLQDMAIRYGNARHEDVIFLQRALYVAKQIKYIDAPMFLYRNNPVSVTHQTENVTSIYGPLLLSWLELLDWHEQKHADDQEVISVVKHMICVYTIEAVEKLYQTGIAENDAELLISKYLPREYLDNYKIVLRSKNQIKRVSEYQNNRKEFIKRQRKIGVKNRILHNLAKIVFLRPIADMKKYPQKLKEELQTE